MDVKVLGAAAQSAAEVLPAEELGSTSTALLGIQAAQTLNESVPPREVL